MRQQNKKTRVSTFNSRHSLVIIPDNEPFTERNVFLKTKQTQKLVNISARAVTFRFGNHFGCYATRYAKFTQTIIRKKKDRSIISRFSFPSLYRYPLSNHHRGAFKYAKKRKLDSQVLWSLDFVFIFHYMLLLVEMSKLHVPCDGSRSFFDLIDTHRGEFNSLSC